MRFSLSAMFILCGLQKKKKSNRNQRRVPVAWWSCEFRRDLWRKVVAYQPLDSREWIVKMAADKEGGRWRWGGGGGGSRRLGWLRARGLLSVWRRLWKIKDAVSCCWIVLLTQWFCLFFVCFFPLAAPSTVSIMHQVSRTVDSITLSWSQPDQPNGVILDYELQYYEKVALVLHCLHGL